METIPALMDDGIEERESEVDRLARLDRESARLPSGFGTVHLESGDRVGGYLRVTDAIVVCWLKSPDGQGNTCKIWPWWRVMGVDLVEDE